MKPVHLALAVLLTAGCVGSPSSEPRSKAESVQCLQNREAIRFVGYQGSDEKQHHFIVRIMDSWTFFQVSKRELTLPDEKIFPSATSAQLYYYLVDPSRDFEKKELNSAPEPTR